jgi:hypothetical protein
MHIHQRSNVGFVKYQPEDGELYFNHLGQLTKKCYWKPSEFYIAADCKLIECDTHFKSEYLIPIGKKLETIKFLDRSLVIQMTDEESYVDAHMFDMRVDEFGDYFFNGLLFEINLKESYIVELIDAINLGRWNEIKFTIFFNESLLINSLIDAEFHKFANYSLRIADFTIAI